MSRILKAFIKFIEFTDITRDLLNNANDKNYNMFKTLNTLFLCSTPICIGEILHLYKLPSFLRILLYIPITVTIVRLFVTKVFKGFTLLPTKLSHFMFYGSLYTIVVFSITLEFNPKILSRSTVELFVQDFEIVNSVLIPTLVATLFWSLCSCFTATRIAIAGNAILTGIVTLLREIALGGKFVTCRIRIILADISRNEGKCSRYCNKYFCITSDYYSWMCYHHMRTKRLCGERVYCSCSLY